MKNIVCDTRDFVLIILSLISLQNQSVTKLRQKRHGGKLFGTERGFIEIKQLPPPKCSQGFNFQWTKRAIDIISYL